MLVFFNFRFNSRGMSLSRERNVPGGLSGGNMSGDEMSGGMECPAHSVSQSDAEFELRAILRRAVAYASALS